MNARDSECVVPEQLNDNELLQLYLSDPEKYSYLAGGVLTDRDNCAISILLLCLVSALLVSTLRAATPTPTSTSVLYCAIIFAEILHVHAYFSVKYHWYLLETESAILSFSMVIQVIVTLGVAASFFV